jgi:hypothetical protein
MKQRTETQCTKQTHNNMFHPAHQYAVSLRSVKYQVFAALCVKYIVFAKRGKR